MRRKVVEKAGMAGNVWVPQANCCRHELKYVISEAQAAAMIACIRALVPPDVHAQRGGYPIVSLYLDSSDLRLCRESLEGVKNRFKLRIRSYSDAPEALYAFEIKRRMNRIIVKSRTWVCREDVPTLVGGSRSPSARIDPQEASLAQFLHYQTRFCAAPVLRVRYLREAYEDHGGNRLRITFDRQLQFNVTATPNVQMNGSGWQPFPGQPVVLEIKFTARFPAWLGRAVRALAIQDRSFSKYALSVKHACGRRFCAPMRTTGVQV
jgi:hypothetical protein